MPRSEDILNSIWQDLDDLPNDAMLLYLWSWTNERCGMAGIYRCPRRLLLEGRLDDGALEAALGVLAEKGHLLYQDGVLWCVARVKQLRTKSAQIAESINRDLAAIDPANPLFAAFIERYDGYPWGKNFEAHLSLNRASTEAQVRLDRASTEPRVSLNRASTEAQDEIGSVEPNDGASGEPQPSLNRGSGEAPRLRPGSRTGKGSQGTTTRVDLTDAAPEHIRAALPAVVETLGRISETRSLPFADEHRTCAAMVAYPAADHVAVASDMEDWLCNSDHGKHQRVKDLVQTFRNQLDRKQPANGKPAEPKADLSAYDGVMEPAV